MISESLINFVDKTFPIILSLEIYSNLFRFEYIIHLESLLCLQNRSHVFFNDQGNRKPFKKNKNNRNVLFAFRELLISFLYIEFAYVCNMTASSIHMQTALFCILFLRTHKKFLI